jgi:hypothetical protein
MSLLSIIQDAMTDINLNRPTSVVGSTDTQVIQFLSLVKRDGLDLLRRFDWQSLTKEVNFTTVATEQQTTLATVASDFFRLVDESMNNRTQHWRVRGPLSPQEWQRRRALGAQVGVDNSFRIRGDAILFFPVPVAGDSIYFEYISNKWVLSNASVAKIAFTADTDTSLINEDILTLGAKWRFLKAKGLDYSEEFRSYESALESIFGSDGARGPVDMTGDFMDWTVPVVPDGSWNIL